MSFEVTADAYQGLMGQYSEQLATAFADLAGVQPGQRVLDVGCGPGALTAELVGRLGPAQVSAAEPSQSFAAAVRDRLPRVDVRQAAAEDLPFPDATFDAALAQLVVQFMTDPVAGIREMARVTRPGGMVAACVWDSHGGRSPLTVFWWAASDLDPSQRVRPPAAGTRAGDLAALFAQGGLGQPGDEASTLTVRAHYASFEDWWEPFTQGVGPGGSYLLSLPAPLQDLMRERCQQLLPRPIEISATAWALAVRRG